MESNKDRKSEILSCRFDKTGQNIAACSADRSVCELLVSFKE